MRRQLHVLLDEIRQRRTKSQDLRGQTQDNISSTGSSAPTLSAKSFSPARPNSDRPVGFATVISIDSSESSLPEMSTQCEHMDVQDNTPPHSMGSNRSYIPSPPHISEEVERAAERNASRAPSSKATNKDDLNSFFRYRERVPSADPTIYGDRQHSRPQSATAATWSHGPKMRMHSPLESMWSQAEESEMDAQNHLQEHRRTLRERRQQGSRPEYVPWKSLEGLADIANVSNMPQQYTMNKNKNRNAAHYRSLPKLSGTENPGYDPPPPVPPAAATHSFGTPLRQAMSWSNLLDPRTNATFDYSGYGAPPVVPAYMNRAAAAWRHAHSPHDPLWRQQYMFASQKDLVNLSYPCGPQMYRSMHDFMGKHQQPQQPTGYCRTASSYHDSNRFAPPPYWTTNHNMPQEQCQDNCGIMNMGPAPANCGSGESGVEGESGKKKSRGRGCMVGWMLGCTAIIILALAIALVVQVTKDAQHINRLRAAVSKQWKQYEQTLDEHI